jgi:hypothetical protein
MKKIYLILSIAASIIFSNEIVAQDSCEKIAKDCQVILVGNGGGRFVSDGQVYTAFLDREKAEFKTTFFGGSTYRIAASAGSEDDFVIFTVKDLEGNILFTNRKYKNSSHWDFKVDSTIPVVIETELDTDKKITGCAVLMIGFKK